jgi:hypothetical protein
MLLAQLSEIGKQEATLGREFTRDLLGEAAEVFARNFLELPSGGKARKYAKALLKQQQRTQRAEAERAIEARFSAWLQSIRDFFSTVSIVKPRLDAVGNSKELIKKMNKVYNYKRLEAKIRNTVLILRSLLTEPIMWNRDIPDFLQKKQIDRHKEQPKEIILRPEKPFTGVRELQKILENADGYVKIIDPYIDEETLDALMSIPKELPIRFITSFTGGEEKERRFVRLCRKFKIERLGFEIRKCDPNLIHDRFILTKSRGWSIGASLKDIGKRLSMIKELSPKAKTEMDTLFEQIWISSIKLLV